MGLGTIELADERVRLRPLLASDVAALALAADESREQYRFNPVPDGLADAERWIAHALSGREAGARYPFVIERDSAFYSILAAEWSEVKARLTARLADG